MLELERIMAAEVATPRTPAPAPAPRPAPSAPAALRAPEPRVPPPRRAPIREEPDENTLRVVPFDELEPSDNRLRRRRPAGAARGYSESANTEAPPLPQRTTIGKDASFLSLLSTKRFEAWKGRSADHPQEHDVERVWEPEVEPVRRVPPSAAPARSLPPAPAAARPAPAVARAATPNSSARTGTTTAGRGHIAESLPGRWLRGEHGPCFAAFEAVAHNSMFGAVEVGEARGLGAAHFRALDRGGELTSLDGAVFLDLETTGTDPTSDIPFVIGLGQPGRDSFDVEQLAVHHPGEELAALGALVQRLKDVQALVTYNGQRFDLRFLRTRFAKYGLDPTPLDRMHFDLYLMARKAWGRTQPRYRLVDLEQNVLGYSRVDDVPGAEAPLRYAQFRRTGDVTPILPIFEHNRHDIVAMFPLLGRIARQMSQENE
jgi:uncharacterized protein YprB with RNaseH-like and TPR domain